MDTAVGSNMALTQYIHGATSHAWAQQKAQNVGQPGGSGPSRERQSQKLENGSVKHLPPKRGALISIPEPHKTSDGGMPL